MGVLVIMCTPDRNDLRFGTVVVLDTVSQPTGLGFKRTWVGVRESEPIYISRECPYILVA